MMPADTTTWTAPDLWALLDKYPGRDGAPALRISLLSALALEATACAGGDGHDYGACLRHHGAWWERQDVRAEGAALSKLADAGILRRSGRRHPDYQVVEPDRLARALDAYPMPAASAEGPPDRPALPADAFAGISGHAEVQALLRLALGAAKPVHVLLVGPPATGKSLLLEAVASCPGATYWLGGTVTKAGLRDLLLAQAAGPVLVLDELDKMGAVDLPALLGVMESGLVTVLQSRRQERVVRPVWVVAGANTTRGLSVELRSRFHERTIAAYTADELCRVMAEVLVAREGVDPELAQEIATRCHRRTPNVREAVRVARLCHGDRRQLPAVWDALGWPPG